MDTEEFDRYPLRQKCPYGFTCSNMPKLSPSDTASQECANLSQCEKAAKYGSRTLFPYGKYEKLKSRFDSLDQRKNLSNKAKNELEEIRPTVSYVESIRSHEKVVSTLERRRKGQDYSDFGVRECISLIEKKLQQLRSNLHNNCYLKRDYIASEGVEVNSYSVKHPPSSNFPQGTSPEEIRKNQKVYLYHKLKSKTAQFRSEKENGEKSKVIHLGKSNDEKNIQARLGIERRNRLSKIRTKLIQAETALKEAEELAAWEFSFDEIVEKSERKD